jgi:hypothetical protein
MFLSMKGKISPRFTSLMVGPLGVGDNKITSDELSGMKKAR